MRVLGGRGKDDGGFCLVLLFAWRGVDGISGCVVGWVDGGCFGGVGGECMGWMGGLVDGWLGVVRLIYLGNLQG